MVTSRSSIATVDLGLHAIRVALSCQDREDNPQDDDSRARVLLPAHRNTRNDQPRYERIGRAWTARAGDTARGYSAVLPDRIPARAGRALTRRMDLRHIGRPLTDSTRCRRHPTCAQRRGSRAAGRRGCKGLLTPCEAGWVQRLYSATAQADSDHAGYPHASALPAGTQQCLAHC